MGIVINTIRINMLVIRKCNQEMRLYFCFPQFIIRGKLDS